MPDTYSNAYFEGSGVLLTDSTYLSTILKVIDYGSNPPVYYDDGMYHEITFDSLGNCSSQLTVDVGRPEIGMDHCRGCSVQSSWSI